MGIQSASATFTRFTVQDPVQKDFWDFVENALKEGSFNPVQEDRSEASGFASWDDLFDTSFDFTSYHKAEYVAFRFRVDRRKVPSILLKQQVQTAIQEHREKSEGKWPSRQEKLEIREDVLDRLLARSLPQPAACDLVWNTRNKTLLVGTSGQKMLDAVRGHLETFLRLYPAPLYHAAWAQRLLPPAGPEQAALQSLVSTQSSNAMEEGRSLGYDFLTWLWFFSETEGGRFTLSDDREAEIHPGERLVLSLPEDGRERVICTTPAVSLHEARTALRRGKRVEEIQLFMKIGDTEYVLRLDTSLWAIRGLRTPKQLKDPEDQDNDGLFLEKMYFLEEVSDCLDAAYKQFLSLRLSGDWDGGVGLQMKKWADEETP
jgi:hypothetical protein